MAKIQTIKNKDNVIVYPQTHTQAVYDADGKKLQEWMNEYLTTEDESAIEDVNTSFEIQGNKTTVLDSNSTDTQYPAAKTVYDFVTQSIGTMAGQLKIEVVGLLPSVGDNSTIYLVPNDLSDEASIYDEYLYLNNHWEKIGSTKVDLTKYLTIVDANNKYATITGADEKYALKNIYGEHAINHPCLSAQGFENSLGRDNEFLTAFKNRGNILLGYGLSSSIEGQIILGHGNKKDTEGKYHLIIGGTAYDAAAGITDEIRSNDHTIDWDGNAWYAGTLKLGGTDYDNGAKEVATQEYVNNKITYGTTTLEDGVSELATGTLYVVYEE